MAFCVTMELLPWEVDGKHCAIKRDLCTNLRYDHKRLFAVLCGTDIFNLKWQLHFLVVNINLKKKEKNNQSINLYVPNIPFYGTYLYVSQL